MPNHGLAVRMRRAVVRRGRRATAEPPASVRSSAVLGHTVRALAVNRPKRRPVKSERLFEAGRPRVWHRRGLVRRVVRKPPVNRNGHAVATAPTQVPLFQPVEVLEKAGAAVRSAWTSLATQVEAAEVPDKVSAFARSAWSSLSTQVEAAEVPQKIGGLARSVWTDLTGRAHALAKRVATARVAAHPKPALPGQSPNGIARPLPGSTAFLAPGGVSEAVSVPAAVGAGVSARVAIPAPRTVEPAIRRMPAPGVPRERTGLAAASPLPRADGLGCVHTGVALALPVTAKVPMAAIWAHRGALGALLAWAVGLVWSLVAPGVTALLSEDARLPDLPPLGDGRVVVGVAVFLVLLVAWAAAADWHEHLRRQAARDWLNAQCEECRYHGLTGGDLDAFIHPSRMLGIAAAAMACLGVWLVGLGVSRAIMGTEAWAGQIELMICSAMVAFVLAGGALRTNSHQSDAHYHELLDIRLGERA